MKKFRTITVNESTFEAVDLLTRMLVPKVNLSKAQVVENLAKNSLGNKPNTQENNDSTDKRPTK